MRVSPANACRTCAKRVAILIAVLLSAFASRAVSVSPYADNLASLVDPPG